MNKTYFYPAIFEYADDGISICFPDLPGCLSCGDTDIEAYSMASDALGLHIYSMIEDGEELPPPSNFSNIKTNKNQVVVLIETYMPAIEAKVKKHFVKKTLSIPAELNAKAERAGINFSQTLQNALLEKFKHAN